MTDDQKILEVKNKLFGPKYLHDCPGCRYLGEVTERISLEESRIIEAYYCVRQKTFCGRYGEERKAYNSFPIQTWLRIREQPSMKEHWMHEAYALFKARKDLQ